VSFKQGFSWLVVYTLAAKESHRFMAVWVQAVFGPVISTLLFLVIFAVVFEQRSPGGSADSYLAFLAPGLIMMTILQNAFANSSTSLLISKVNGTIFDVLTAPIRPAELVLGYALGGVVRGLAVGLALTVILAPFGLLELVHVGRIIFFCLGGAFLFALLGILGGVWSERMEHVAFMSNIIIMPLTILSGTFFSVQLLPDWLRLVAAANPIFYLIDGFRSGFIGQAESPIWLGIGATLAFCAFLLALNIYLVWRGYGLKS
jgi:ABC-2 type transport system permease protein